MGWELVAKGSAAPCAGRWAGTRESVALARSAALGVPRPPGISNPSCRGHTESEDPVGSKTPHSRPPGESATDKSFKQTALNWNYRGIYPTLGEAPLGAKVFFVGYFGVGGR